MINKTLITFVSIVVSTTAFSQSFNSEKLNQYFNNLEANEKFMGSVAVSKNGKLLYTKSIGFADVSSKLKANENTKYRIGSISKTFTAVLVLKAVEQNKLKLTDKLDKYFPNIKNAGKITIENLLNHRSGIHNFTDDSNYTNWNTQKKSEKDMLEIITEGGSDFEPDSKTSYSNSNYVLLTYILEKAFNKSYAVLLKKYITTPLQLKNTYLGSKINTKNNEANSYKSENNQWFLEPETDISIPLGAGGIVSTPTDLVQFSNALFGGKLVSKTDLEFMKTIKDGLGSGLFQFPFYEIKAYGHNGGIDGFSSSFTHFDKDNVSFALTSNATNYNNNNVALAVLSAVFEKDYEIPNFKTYVVKPEELAQYVGNYSSSELPIKLSITSQGNILTAQATGQSAFPLEASDKDIFKFEKAGIVIEFAPSEKKMMLKQGGKEFIFTKD
ncbi:serine hydrolase domain-containing protein [Soonwooa purpurea]